MEDNFLSFFQEIKKEEVNEMTPFIEEEVAVEDYDEETVNANMFSAFRL